MRTLAVLDLALLTGFAAPAIRARTFRVERVIDGGTFKIIYDGELTSVRI